MKEQTNSETYFKKKHITSSHLIKTHSVNSDTFWNAAFIAKLLLQTLENNRFFKFFKWLGTSMTWTEAEVGKYVRPWSTMKDHHFGRFVKTSPSLQERLIKKYFKIILRSFYSSFHWGILEQRGVARKVQAKCFCKCFANTETKGWWLSELVKELGAHEIWWFLCFNMPIAILKAETSLLVGLAELSAQVFRMASPFSPLPTLLLVCLHDWTKGLN